MQVRARGSLLLTSCHPHSFAITESARAAGLIDVCDGARSLSANVTASPAMLAYSFRPAVHNGH
eukprot:3712024-Alexandrium_andersonii.AAC.1